MFVHKDIIIVFLFLFVVSLILLIIFIKDLKIISKSLQNFKGNAVRSDKVFFFNLFQPLIFNLNLIIKNLNEKSKFSRLRIFFYDYFFQFFPDPLLIIDQNNIIIEMNEQAINFFGEDSKQKNIFSAIRIPELSSLIDESVKQKRPVEKELNLICKSLHAFQLLLLLDTKIDIVLNTTQIILSPIYINLIHIIPDVLFLIEIKIHFLLHIQI